MATPTDDPAAASPTLVRRCSGCYGPLSPDTVEDTHPCCDPREGRTVTRWADRLHNERVAARAAAAREAFRSTRRT